MRRKLSSRTAPTTRVRAGLGIGPFSPNNVVMANAIGRFSKDASGQTLSEYALLLAFMLIAVLGLAVNFQGSMAGVTTTTNNNLQQAAGVTH